MLVGDVMGPSLQNLDNLLAMPYGCGEQNMLKFAPNIHIMKYLRAVGQDSASIQKKAVNFMEAGKLTVIL